MWVLGNKLRLLGLAAIALIHWSILLALLFLFKTGFRSYLSRTRCKDKDDLELEAVLPPLPPNAKINRFILFAYPCCKYFLILIFWNGISCSPGWPQTCHVAMLCTAEILAAVCFCLCGVLLPLLDSKLLDAETLRLSQSLPPLYPELK